MTRDLIFIMNYQYIPGQVSVNTLDTHLPESVLKHESCDLNELNELNELVNVLIDEDVELSLLVAQVRVFYSYGSDVRGINFEHIEKCLVNHLLKHLKPGGLEGDADLAVQKIKDFLQKLSDEPVIVGDYRVMVPGLIDVSLNSETGEVLKVA